MHQNAYYPMKDGKIKYRILVHCLLGQIQKGFNTCVESLPFPVTVKYVNLIEDGIISKLKFDPHLIVLLPNKEDSDIMLPVKIKLFAAKIPLLIIIPKVPYEYSLFLEKTGVEMIIQLPADNEKIKNAISSLLSPGKITDFRE